MGAAIWSDWWMSMLNSGCMRLMWRVCGRVILWSSEDVVIKSICVISLYMLFSFSPCKLPCKIWVVYYPMYIALTNSNIFFGKKTIWGHFHMFSNMAWFFTPYSSSYYSWPSSTSFRHTNNTPTWWSTRRNLHVKTSKIWVTFSTKLCLLTQPYMFKNFKNFMLLPSYN